MRRASRYQASRRRRSRRPSLRAAVLYAVCALLVVAGAVFARSVVSGVALPRGLDAALGRAHQPGATPRTEPLPACAFAETMASRTAYADWATTLVDTSFRLPHGYEPPDLVSVAEAGLPGGGRVRTLVVDDLRELAGAARDAGARLRVVSAYRSETDQAGVLQVAENSVGRDGALQVTARPGHSEHQLGTAIDFGANGGADPWAEDWGGSPEGRWLAAHAADYGFVMSYPAAASPERTCYSYEPWHFRYVGRAMAGSMRDSGLSPREFLWRLGSGRER